jgi:hypothetical protein
MEEITFFHAKIDHNQHNNETYGQSKVGLKGMVSMVTWLCV